jgi:hypothetical protein
MSYSIDEWYGDAFPDQLHRAFSPFENNGFGFQSIGGSGPKGSLVVAWTGRHRPDPYDMSVKDPTYNEVTAYLREKVPESKTAECDGYLGRLYLRIHFSEWNLIPAVFNAILSHVRRGHGAPLPPAFSFFFTGSMVADHAKQTACSFCTWCHVFVGGHGAGGD